MNAFNWHIWKKKCITFDIVISNEWPHFTVTHAIHRTKSYNSKFNSVLNVSRYLNRTYFMSKTRGKWINEQRFVVSGPMSATMLNIKCLIENHTNQLFHSVEKQFSWMATIDKQVGDCYYLADIIFYFFLSLGSCNFLEEDIF